MKSRQDAGLIAFLMIVLAILLAHKAGFKPTRVFPQPQPTTALSSTYMTLTAPPTQSRMVALVTTTAAILFDIEETYIHGSTFVAYTRVAPAYHTNAPNAARAKLPRSPAELVERSSGDADTHIGARA